MDDKGTVTATSTEAPTAPIVFRGRTIQTYLPNEAQIAVIARMTFWTADSMGKDVNRFRTGVNRVGALLAGLMADQADWDFIEDGMAAREIEWDGVLGIFNLIAEAHGLVNREDRRATAKKTGGKKARRG